MRYNDYDALAPVYAGQNEQGAYNALYERPATLALAGDVTGLRVLDAGCGTGGHAAALVAGGATVTGIDGSAGMLALARERLGAAATLLHHDLGEPIPLPDNGFDLVLAPLLLHYFEDWVPLLREFARVLVGGGRLVVSTHHPFADHLIAGGTDYFATYQVTEDWDGAHGPVPMRFWHRPLTAMHAAFAAAGFTVDTVTEPRPVEECRERYPEAYQRLCTHPGFLFFTARA